MGQLHRVWQPQSLSHPSPLSIHTAGPLSFPLRIVQLLPASDLLSLPIHQPSHCKGDFLKQKAESFTPLFKTLHSFRKKAWTLYFRTQSPILAFSHLSPRISFSLSRLSLAVSYMCPAQGPEGSRKPWLTWSLQGSDFDALRMASIAPILGPITESAHHPRGNCGFISQVIKKELCLS